MFVCEMIRNKEDLRGYHCGGGGEEGGRMGQWGGGLFIDLDCVSS